MGTAAEGKRIRIRGTVQGVGFRPWVYRMAVQTGVTGRVRNDSSGVTIDAFGAPEALRAFEDALHVAPPPAARIADYQATPIPTEPVTAFLIEHSAPAAERRVSIPPDLATCDDCVRDIFDSTNRRYRYAFTNCTNCGPRFTIATDVPYDRGATTMAPFEMCGPCRHEYEDVLDRRFHAQPTACPDCGPELTIVWTGDVEVVVPGLSRAGQAHLKVGTTTDPIAITDLIATVVVPGLSRAGQAHLKVGTTTVNPIATADPIDTADPIVTAADALRRGLIVALKGIGGFHLACDATSEAAVARLRERKHREEKPLAVMVPTIDAADALAYLTPAHRALLLSPERPIVLADRRDGTMLAPSIAPRNRQVGLLLPYSPLHHLLIADAGRPLVMTSGNRSDEPIAFTNDDAKARLGGIADLLLLHDREIHTRCDDSVATVVSGAPLLIRRSRGYVPRAVTLGTPLAQPVLATGALLKNTFCLAAGTQAFLGPHIGDLENLETYDCVHDGYRSLPALRRHHTRGRRVRHAPGLHVDDVRGVASGEARARPASPRACRGGDGRAPARGAGNRSRVRRRRLRDGRHDLGRRDPGGHTRTLRASRDVQACRTRGRRCGRARTVAYRAGAPARRIRWCRAVDSRRVDAVSVGRRARHDDAPAA
ncbi:MAG: Sua5/YciO/YrdC/YwlC family protein [Vicinamibacterales bacterium]